MEAKFRIVTQLPLRGLWKDTGPVRASRLRALSSAEIRELLRLSPVQFVVAGIGLKPRWIDVNDCYRFWMDEVQHHMAEPGAKIPDHMPGVYCYHASEWQSEEIASPIVVLEL